MIMNEELNNLHELITSVRLDIRELNTKMDSIKDLTKRVEDIQDMANRAFVSTKEAHHRLDSIERIIFWVGTTIFGGVIVSLVAFVVKGGLVIK